MKSLIFLLFISCTAQKHMVVPTNCSYEERYVCTMQQKNVRLCQTNTELVCKYDATDPMAKVF
jgi:hypothetical protein